VSSDIRTRNHPGIAFLPENVARGEGVAVGLSIILVAHMNPDALAVGLMSHRPNSLFSRDTELCPSGAELTVTQGANTSSIAVAMDESGYLPFIRFSEGVWETSRHRLWSPGEDEGDGDHADDKTGEN